MEYRHNPPTLAELRSLKQSVRQPHMEARQSFSSIEKFALKMTHAIGSMGFFFLLTFWTLSWVAWNLWGPSHMRFDPGPAFFVWLFVSNILQLILLPLILVGQNLEGKYAEHRAQADFEINKKAEHEIEVIIAHLENQNELLLELAKKIERK